MKKILKFIPLVVTPMLLTSCILRPFFPSIHHSSSEENTSETIPSESTSNPTSIEDSEEPSTSIHSEETTSEGTSHGTSEITTSESTSQETSIIESETSSEGTSVDVSSEDVSSEEVSSAETSSEEASSAETSSEDDKDEWTILVYMCGADLESTSYAGTEYEGQGYNNGNLQGLASMDIDEMLAVSGQPDSVNIAIQTGGASDWGKSVIDANKLQRWHIKNKSFIKDQTINKASMGKQSTLQSFLNWGVETYPAKKYGLILWNHGGGMTGCCFDENFDDDSLTADEVAGAMNSVLSNENVGGKKFEFITYDACLMAIQDIAEINSHYFNYMLCSQETEGGYGYDYDAWLPSLYSNTSISTPDLLEVIGHTFMVEEKEIYEYWGDPFDQTQSVLDLSKMADYKTAFESFASGLAGIVNSSSKWNTFKNTANTAQKYGKYSESWALSYNNGYLYDMFDADQVLAKLYNATAYSSIKTQIQAVRDALKDVIVYEEHGDSTTGCGLCIYIPICGYNDADSYTSQTNFTNWKNLITSYGNWYYGY